MKTISPGLSAHLQQELSTTAVLIKITRRDSTVMGFTSFDRDLVVSGVTYKADNAFAASELESRQALSTDNLSIAGMISSGAVTEEDILSGKYDHARVDVYLCNWADLSQGVMQLRRGWLGEVTVRGGQFQAELRGLHDLMQRPVGDRFTPSCRHDLGNAHCGVDLVPLTVIGTATSVVDAANFTDSTRSEPNGHFDGGLLTFTSGANAGFAAEIRVYAAKSFSLWLSAPFPVVLGAGYSAIPGCDKRLSTCKNRYDKGVNFGGFPHLPGIDRILNYPEARGG
jgi:uncharacterized phage protein (TIGR02218 family)